MPKSPDAHVWYDGLFDFSAGMDSGVQPLLIKRNQAAFITNGTIRQSFMQQRPAFNKLTINYGGNTALQTAVETGLYQGGCFYQPDFGNQCLMAAISGHLYQFSIAGNIATVTDVTIPGDPNPATVTQAWLWQSENYVIWNDGLSLPVFYNGSTSRRSLGAEALVGTTAASFTAPAVGATVPVTFTAPYTGPLNQVIQILPDTFYLVSGAGTVFTVVLTNISETPGATVTPPEQIVSMPSVLGVLAALFPTQGLGNYPLGTALAMTMTLPYSGAVGDLFNLFGGTWKVLSINGAALTVVNITATTSPTGSTVPVGTQIVSATSSAPNVVVGNLTAPFTVPAQGSTITVGIDSQYLGAAGLPVYIETGQYTIAAGPVTPPGAIVTLVNINDTVSTPHNAPTQFFTIPELPPGRMGVYGMGRNWECLVDGKSFIASDIVGGSAGTPAQQSRDSVLKITENTYLAGGGVFQVPGSIGDIRAMIFTAMLDQSMGQGALQVLTSTHIFSCNAPVDRTTWQSLTNPILTMSLIANGGQGQNNTIAVNGDTFFRSVDGIRSLILGQRQFSTWGNVPLSLEVDRIIEQDNTQLLSYGSAAVFDNRVIYTAAPQASPQGVFHEAAIVLNLDPIRSIDEKTQPVYDGMWTGINVLQYISGVVNGVQRLFAFTLDVVAGRIEIYEVLTDTGGDFDNGVIPVTWGFETASLFKDIKQKGILDLVRLEDGEIYVDDVIGTVNFQVLYKPDQYPCWTPWYSWSICAVSPNPLAPTANDVNLKPQFRTRMGLGKPSASACDADTGFPMREGSTFQFKFVITGHCRFLGAKFMAVSLPDIYFAKPVCAAICPPV